MLNGHRRNRKNKINLTIVFIVFIVFSDYYAHGTVSEKPLRELKNVQELSLWFLFQMGPPGTTCSTV